MWRRGRDSVCVCVCVCVHAYGCCVCCMCVYMYMYISSVFRGGQTNILRNRGGRRLQLKYKIG